VSLELKYLAIEKSGKEENLGILPTRDV